MARREFEQAERKFRIMLQLQVRAKVRAFPMHAEIGVLQPSQAVAELRKQPAILRFARLHRVLRETEYRARVPVVFAHETRRVALLPLLRQRVLSVKREHVRVAPRARMQIQTDLCEMQK